MAARRRHAPTTGRLGARAILLARPRFVHEETWMPQGTVKTFDPETGTGVVVQDDLVERPIDREAFTASRLMELRLGQRVRFELEEQGDDVRITQLNIVSL
jgi:cold shock CspA family protein